MRLQRCSKSLRLWWDNKIQRGELKKFSSLTQERKGTMPKDLMTEIDEAVMHGIINGIKKVLEKRNKPGTSGFRKDIDYILSTPEVPAMLKDILMEMKKVTDEISRQEKESPGYIQAIKNWLKL